MKADLARQEPERLQRWLETQLYQRVQERRADAPPYSVQSDPLTMHGDARLDSAFGQILKDTLIRYKALRGYHAPHVPRWSPYGLSVEVNATHQLCDNEAPSAPVRQACSEYARHGLEIHRDSFRRLGILGDWERPSLPHERAHVAQDLRLLADLVDHGYIYRERKPVPWSIPCRTALGEPDLEYQEQARQGIYVKFPILGHSSTFLLVWTARPWALTAIQAVAFHPGFSYSLVQVGREHFIVSVWRLSAVTQACRWPGYQILRSLDAGHLSQLEYQHPFSERTGRLIADESLLDSATGAGFVPVAPGLSLADYQVGIRHQLSIDAPVDDDGRLAHTSSMPGEMVGKSVLERNGRSEANDAVLHALRQRRAIAHQEDYRHRTPFCRYSRTPVIHRATAQWFLRLDHLVLRTRALEAIRRIQWLQEPARARAEDELRGWPDWCLSRQRAWGLPLPAFFTAEGNPLLDASVVRRLADLVEVEGPNVWFEKPAAELWTAVRPANWQGLEPVTRSPDTLDVRFDSRCVLSLPTRGPGPQATPAPIPIDLYVTSSDPLESWVLSTLLLSLTASETAPLRSVLACSPPAELTRRLGARGQPSRCGPAASPLAEEVRTCGADVVRWWAVSQGCHTGIRKSQAQPQAAGATYRSIRNALRFQLSNLYDFDPAQHALPVADLTRLDRWLLEAFSQLEETVLEAYDRCDLPAVCQQLSHFIADQLSATYFDIIKDRLYTESPQSFRRRSTQTALCRLLTGLCQMLAPVLVFTADEAWELIPGCSGKSVHESDWKPSHFARPEPERAEWENLLALRRLALPVLEQSRRNRQIGKALNAKVTFQGGDPVLITGQARAEELRELLKVSQLEFLPAACPAISVTISPASGHKCERCWHWTEDVGRAPDHPGLCARCVGLAGILP